MKKKYPYLFFLVCFHYYINCSAQNGTDENGILFKDVTNASGINHLGGSFGHAWGDINGDGFDDLFLGNHGYPYIYINKKDGTFQEKPLNYYREYDTINGEIIPTKKFDLHGASFGDINGDGFLDLYVAIGGDNGNSEGKQNVLFLNGGDSLIIINKSKELGLQDSIGRGRTPLWFDQNGDEKMDLFLSNLTRDDGKFNSPLYIQENNGQFSAIRNFTLLENYSIYFSTLLYNEYYKKNQLFCLSESGDLISIYNPYTIPFGNMQNEKVIGARDGVIADFNGDGRQDIFVVSNNWGSEAVQVNDKKLSVFLKDNTQTNNFLKNRISFKSENDITVLMSLFPYKDSTYNYIHIGSQGLHPNTSGEFTLSKNNPNHIGFNGSCPTCIGILIGYNTTTQAWDIIVTDPLAKAGAAITITSSSPITDLKTFNFSNNDLLARDRMLLQNSNGSFSFDNNFMIGNDSWTSSPSVIAADFDNDMDVDIILATSGGSFNSPDLYYENDGNGNFTSKTGMGCNGSSIGRSGALSAVDFNNDGFMDFLAENGEGKISDDGVPLHFNSGPTLLFQNKGNSNKWVEFDLRQKEGNTMAIGTKLFCYAGGKKQIRVRGSENHAFCQNTNKLHFGLGRNIKIDSIVIIWPDESVKTFYNIYPNAIYTIVKGETEIVGVGENVFRDLTIFPNPVSKNLSFSGTYDTIGEIKVSIYNNLGVLLFVRNYINFNKKETITLGDNFPNGQYHLIIEGKNQERKDFSFIKIGQY